MTSYRYRYKERSIKKRRHGVRRIITFQGSIEKSIKIISQYRKWGITKNPCVKKYHFFTKSLWKCHSHYFNYKDIHLLPKEFDFIIFFYKFFVENLRTNK